MGNKLLLVIIAIINYTQTCISRRSLMHSHMHFTLACAILFYLLGSTFYASDTSTHINEVADGVYVRLRQTGVGFIANIGFIVGEQCVAVIDTGGSVAEGENLKKSISRFTDTPICYVINTHVHPDHILGNQAFKSRTVKFIGHHRLPRAMALARAFSAQAPVLLLDEPFVSLDELTTETLRKLLLQQLQQRQMMAVFVTHNLREALFLADRLIILGDTPTSVVENIAFEAGTRGRALEQVESLRNQLIQDYAWILG